jgi:DNA-binding LacI/PurR family transcriptional regulator
MRTLHYRPHFIARSLASKRTHIIAILFPCVDHGIGLSEIDLIMQAAKASLALGYHLVIWTLQTNTEEELRQLTGQSLVDGIILMEVHRADKRIAVLKEQGIPFILMGRDAEDTREPFVDIDFSTTMAQCVSYLKGLGHRRLCFINQSEKSFIAGYGPVVRAHEAFTLFCKKHDVEGTALFCDSDPVKMYAITENLLARDSAGSGISAFLVMNDKALPGLIEGIKQRGYRIPEDKSIVSMVSSAGSASLFLPPVTAFEMDIHTLMDSVVTQLTAKLDGRFMELPLRLIPCVLRERQSTGRPPFAL